jgi:monoamine oxidase
VTRLRWNGPGGRVVAETPHGSVSAKAAIVTVSTGVLAAGTIAFDPALPAPVQDCVDALPMGLAMKVAMRATGPDRLDLPPYSTVARQVSRRGDRLVPFQCWPHGRDYVQSWIGGSVAWDLARAGEAAAVDFTLERLRAIFGGRVDPLFRGGGHLVTRWDADPFVLGAYSWVPVGQADARRRLGQPQGDGHLLFAGEACHVGLAGTLAGAWLSGEAAALACRI